MTHTKCVMMILLTVVCVSLSTGVHAEQSENALCAEASTTAAMRECLNRHHGEVDRELNEVYRQVMGQLSQDRKTKLREAQRTWILFRDKSAEFVASEVEGGSMYPLVHLSALTSLTEERINHLKAVLQQLDSR